MKISKIFTISKCPSCKYENKYVFNTEDYDTDTIIRCNKNMGGCGRAYIIHTNYEIIIECKAYKIDDNDELKLPDMGNEKQCFLPYFRAKKCKPGLKGG